ncbi:hypothetical protein Pint_16869 [Pistacia integerrima]|uniref:Uncharacterized protein n=1 Tax=Pistacia integerrima TaxID=434235 RepID=A0ACC0ZE78_9ROSI|nr:hypothetical protein Pint_16869 [Pistacia integerrima]
MAELVIPNHFQCPITLELMKDPVTLSSGITYDRDNIETWLGAGNFTCPVTNQVLRSFDQIPNHTLRKMIQDWCVENRTHGVERIPTPRVPVTSGEVSEILFIINFSVKNLDQCGVLDSLNVIKKWGFESERNKLCIVANGASEVLAEAFDAFAQNPEAFERFSNVLIEILSALNWMLPLDDKNNKSFKLLTSQASLRCMVWFMKHSQDIPLKEIKSFDQQEIEVMIDSGVDEILIKFIEEPFSRTITKASLMVIFAMISSPNEKIKSSFVEKGLVLLLLNLIVDSEKSICEKGLGVLDRLFESKEGREEAYQNALTVPVLVKKILRVSELATEFSVSAIWKLSKFDKKNEGKILFEALQVGVFQKLVLLLQCGCDDSTKEKTSQLLKLMNPYRAGLECTESSDFKNLKRSF